MDFRLPSEQFAPFCQSVLFCNNQDFWEGKHNKDNQDTLKMENKVCIKPS